MSPRTPQQFREIRQEKIALIMDTGLEHFANEGYFKTTISHLARHAGISKGLLYNYFESKEALLKAIVHRSVNEIYHYIDIDKNGYLSEEEFEFLIRKTDMMLKSKKNFWRLIFQLLMQNDVRELFLNAFPENDSLDHPGHEPGDTNYPSQILKIIRDYFAMKKAKKGMQSDPETEANMFFITIAGYALSCIYADNDNKSRERSLARIIEIYK